MVFNLAANAKIDANATCGDSRPETYCKLVEHVPEPPQNGYRYEHHLCQNHWSKCVCGEGGGKARPPLLRKYSVSVKIAGKVKI